MDQENFRVEKFIRIVSMDKGGARDFATVALGCPIDRIDRITDEGPPVQPEKHKPGARLFYVWLRGEADNVR